MKWISSLEWYQHHSWIRRLLFLSNPPFLTITIWYPSTDKSAFVGAVGSSTIHQETQEKSHPPMCWVIGMQILVPAVDPEWPMNWLQPLLAMVCEALENTVLDNHPWTRDLLWKSRFPTDKCQHTTEAKQKVNLDTMERVRGTFWHFSNYLSPKAVKLRAKRDLARDFYHSEKRECVSAQLPQLCRLLPKTLISLLPHPQYWIVSSVYWGWGETGRRADRILRGHEMNKNPINCIVNSTKKLTNELLGTPHLWISPPGSWASPMLCVPYPHTHLPCGQLPMQAPKSVSDSKLWQIAREHVQKASPNLQARENP